MYLHGKKSRSGESDPAVNGVEVGNLIGIVVLKHGTQSDHGHDEGDEHQGSMQQLPGQFVRTPGQGNTVQNSSCV